jgi:hypothetical protein
MEALAEPELSLQRNFVPKFYKQPKKMPQLSFSLAVVRQPQLSLAFEREYPTHAVSKRKPTYRKYGKIH